MTHFLYAHINKLSYDLHAQPTQYLLWSIGEWYVCVKTRSTLERSCVLHQRLRVKINYKYNDEFSFRIVALIPMCLCCPVLLRWQGWEPCTCSSADLPQTTERHGQAELHLHLPELGRLVWQHLPLLPACPPLPGQQRRGADTSQKPLHQCSAWWVPGQCTDMPGKGDERDR